MKKVCIVGLGYIGLPTAIVAADHGLEVVGFDIDARRVEKINVGDPVIKEPEIGERLAAVVEQKKLRATSVIEAADIFVIAVPTPFTEDKNADLSYVWSAAESIAAVVRPGDVVILESTVPVGTTEQLANLLTEKTGYQVGTEIFVAHCPERVLPGKIFKELIHNARIIGGIEPRSVDAAKQFYKYFVKGSLYLTDATTAEMVKLVENSSRDVDIAFAHQVASMAALVGLDPYEVIELANKHPRVNILRPSCGVGGHCLAVDPWFLVETFPQQTALLKTAREVNDAKPYEVLAAIARAKAAHRVRLADKNPTLSAVGNSSHASLQHAAAKNLTITVLGLTYKPNIDDLRESPALFIAQQMQQWKDINLLVVEPYVERERVQQCFASDISPFSPEQIVSFQDGIERADLIICLVAHQEFSILVHHESREKALDFCGLLHIPQQESQEQERLFWPASRVHEWPTPLAVVTQPNEPNKKEHPA